MAEQRGGDTMRITLKEYAIRNGRDPATARQKAGRGMFQTAVKDGRDWFIDSDEPWPDGRIKSGRYVGQHRKREK